MNETKACLLDFILHACENQDELRANMYTIVGDEIHIRLLVTESRDDQLWVLTLNRVK